MKTLPLYILFFVFFISARLYAQKDTATRHANPEERNTTVYTVVEHQPEFPGGMAGLSTYILDNLRCPDEAIQNGISGKVFVRFIVTEIGTVKNAEVVKSIKDCSSCDAAAIRVIEKMPAWKPGKMNGSAVNVLYNLPVSFRCE